MESVPPSSLGSRDQTQVPRLAQLTTEPAPRPLFWPLTVIGSVIDLIITLFSIRICSSKFPSKHCLYPSVLRCCVLILFSQRKFLIFLISWWTPGVLRKLCCFLKYAHPPVVGF